MSTQENHDSFDNIWKIVAEIGTTERHFNDLQSKYRTLASTWLLAAFSAMGFIVSEVIEINVEKELLISGIAIAALIGIMLLWVIDLLVYHRLLDSCFIEGLILEEKYSWLPPIRHNMMATMQGEGVLLRVVGFYIAMAAVLILISGGFIASWLTQYNIYWSLIAVILTLITAFLVGRYILIKTENTAAIEKRLLEFRAKKQ